MWYGFILQWRENFDGSPTGKDQLAEPDASRKYQEAEWREAYPSRRWDYDVYLRQDSLHFNRSFKGRNQSHGNRRRDIGQQSQHLNLPPRSLGAAFAGHLRGIGRIESSVGL
jgi:hypothetical protein